MVELKIMRNTKFNIEDETIQFRDEKSAKEYLKKWCHDLVAENISSIKERDREERPVTIVKTLEYGNNQVEGRMMDDTAWYYPYIELIREYPGYSETRYMYQLYVGRWKEDDWRGEVIRPLFITDAKITVRRG